MQRRPGRRPTTHFDGPVPVGGGMLPPRPRPGGASGHGPAAPPPSLADRASRFGAPQDGPLRPSLPCRSVPPVSGLGDPIADREVKRSSRAAPA